MHRARDPGEKEHKMQKGIVRSVTVAMVLSGTLFAAEVDVKIVNATGGSYFTPLLVTLHAPEDALFKNGETASTALQAMAEGGDISGLSSELDSAGAMISEDPAGGLLAPGASTMTTLMSDAQNTQLSIVAMILPTNDGFVGLESWQVPTGPGSYTVMLQAYDAGTEANDEVVNGGGAPGVAGIPADPGGHAGSNASGVIAAAEGYVHTHRGILGDQNATGGVSDLDSRVHRWLNPVATAIITVH